MDESDFQKKYFKAPKKIQDFLISEELTEITKNMATLANLNRDQIIRLTEIIGNVLLGEISTMDFIQNAASYLEISPAQSRIIIGLAQKQIFNQFTEELKMGLDQKKQEPVLKTTIPITNTEEMPIAESTMVIEEKKEQIADAINESKEQTIAPKEKRKIDELAVKAEKIRERKKEKKQPAETQAEQILPQIDSSKPSNSEYSFPEPAEVKVEKSIDKIGELKKVIAPKATPTQQDKIRQKLMEAMAKKDAQPKVVTEMKNVLQAKKSEEIGKREDEEKTTKQKPITTIEASTIVSGQGEEFKEEQVPQKSTTKKPYVLDVKLKETQEEKKRQEIAPEPVKYKKYKKESPFGKA